MFDYDLVGSDDTLGEMRVDLASAAAQCRDNGSAGCWFKLEGDGSGDGEVELAFEFDGSVLESLPADAKPPEPSTGRKAGISVRVHVIGARNLTAADENTLSDDSSDPYAMVYIGDESKSQQTKFPKSQISTQTIQSLTKR